MTVLTADHRAALRAQPVPQARRMNPLLRQGDWRNERNNDATFSKYMKTIAKKL
jgi:hypothetical protein